jgi:hypothetical protein
VINIAIVRAVRSHLAILLLFAALIHPFAHLAHEAVACPCVHGALVELPLPAVAELQLTPDLAPQPRSIARLAPIESDVPSRAPPFV